MSVPRVYIEGKETEVVWDYSKEKGCMKVSIPKTRTNQKLEITFEEGLSLNENHEIERVHHLLNYAQGDNIAKETAYQILTTGKNLAAALGELQTTGLDEDTRQAVIEIMTAAQ